MATDHSDLLRLAEEIRRQREERNSRLSTSGGKEVAPSRLAIEEDKKDGGSRPFFGGLGSLARKAQHGVQKVLDLDAPQLIPDSKSKKKQPSTKKPTIGNVLKQRAKELGSGEEAVNAVTGDAQLGTQARQQIERVPDVRVPILGNVNVGRGLAEATDIAIAPATLLTAGLGPEAAAALRGAGPAGRLVGALIEPAARGGPAGRLFSEIALGTGSRWATDMAEDKDAPTPVVIASSLVGGALGLWSGNALRGAGKASMRELGGLFGRQSASAMAQQWGFGTDGRTFVMNVPHVNAVVKEITGPTSAFDETGVGRVFNSGVDPSKNYEDQLDKIVQAHARVMGRVPAMAYTSVASALDPHERSSWLRGPGGRAARLFNMDKDGRIKNLTKRGSESAVWGDVFSRPDAPTRYGMSKAQAAYFSDFHQLRREADELLVKNGLAPFRVEGEDEWYVPRIVRGKAGLEIKGHTNHNLERLLETMEDGVQAGVKYENDPRAVADAYVEAAYRAVAQKQFDEAMAPMLVKAKTVLAAKHPGLFNDLVQAVKSRIDVKADIRGSRRAVINERKDVDKDILREAKKGLTKNPDTTYPERARESIMRRLDRNITEHAQTDFEETVKDYWDPKNTTKVEKGPGYTLYRVPGKGFLRVEEPGQEVLGNFPRAVSDVYIDPAHRNGSTFFQLFRLAEQDGSVHIWADDMSPQISSLLKERLSGPLTPARRDLMSRFFTSSHSESRPVYYFDKSTDAVRQEIRESIAEAENFRKSLTSVWSVNGPPITEADVARLDAADHAVAKAKRAIAAKMKELEGSNKETLPGYLFGRSEKEIPVAKWKGSFLPDDAAYQRLAERMNVITGKFNPQEPGALVRVTSAAGNYVRFGSAAGDFALPFNQLLPLMGQSPLQWAKATARFYSAAANPRLYANYLRKNMATIQEMVQHGVPLGDIESFTVADSGALRRVARSGPGRASLGRLANANDMGLTAARVQLWNNLKPIWDGTPAELATYVRNMTGGMNTAALGVSSSQRAVENFWLAFSPKLFRSTVALVAKAGNPETVEGQQAARSLLGLAAFGTSMAVLVNEAIGTANGESEVQIRKRIENTLNPLGGRKFLSVEVGGQYIGVGGQVRAISQFVAKSVANPEGFTTANQFENPLINLYMSRGAMGVNMAGALAEGATGERINVLPFESIDSVPEAALHIGKSSLFFSVQAQLEAENASMLDRWVLGVGSNVGGNVSQMTAADQINQLTQSQYGKPFNELTGVEQQRFEAERPDLIELRDKQRAETGGRESRQKRQKLDQADAERINGERALVDAYQRGLISGPQFRDEMKALQRDAVNQKKGIRGDTDYQTTDENKLALSAWYDTFDQARVSGTEIVDWDKQERLEADLYAKLNPEQRRYIDERRVTEHAPEAQFYFDNEAIIRESGYYEATDEAFARYAGRMPEGIESYSQLTLALDAAQRGGDKRLARRLNTLQNLVERRASHTKEKLRRRDPELDRAMLANGRTTKLVSRQPITTSTP